MQFIGFIWEIALLGIAVYFYAYMRGFIKGKTPKQQKRMDEFRASNKWLIYASMLLGAIMIANLYFRIMEVIGS